MGQGWSASAGKLRSSEEARIVWVPKPTTRSPHEPDHRTPSSVCRKVPGYVAGVQIPGRHAHRGGGARPGGAPAPDERRRRVPSVAVPDLRPRDVARALPAGAAPEAGAVAAASGGGAPVSMRRREVRSDVADPAVVSRTS